MSAVDAGIRLLPYSFVAPVSSMITTTLAGRNKIPIVYFLILGSALQVIGAALLAHIPITTTSQAAIYGYEAITGLGLGITFGVLMLGVPYAVERRDLGDYPTLQRVDQGQLTRFTSNCHRGHDPDSNAWWFNWSGNFVVHSKQLYPHKPRLFS
jgi:hypothetical protein